VGGRLASSQFLPLSISTFIVRIKILPSCSVGLMFTHQLLESKMILIKILVSGLSGCCTEIHKLSVLSEIPTTGIVASDDR